jgi:hypothetical protein
MIYNLLKFYRGLNFYSIIIVVLATSCKEKETYLPNNNENTYIKEKVEDFDPDIITDKMSEVDEEIALKTIVFDCDNPTVKIGGVIIREDEQFNDFNSKNISIPIYYLRLFKSCKIHCNDKGQNKVYENVQTIQIIMDGKIDKLKLVGKKTLVTGQLFGASTSYHKTPVLISAKSFENL